VLPDYREFRLDAAREVAEENTLELAKGAERQAASVSPDMGHLVLVYLCHTSAAGSSFFPDLVVMLWSSL